MSGHFEARFSATGTDPAEGKGGKKTEERREKKGKVEKIELSIVRRPKKATSYPFTTSGATSMGKKLNGKKKKKRGGMPIWQATWVCCS